MIDWISAIVKYPHRAFISGGFVQSVDGDGAITWTVEKAHRIEGSHSSCVMVRSEGLDNGVFQSLYISGNPLKLLQGHNLFGSWDINGLIGGMVRTALVGLHLPYSDLDCENWSHGRGTFFKRVDLTTMLDLGNIERARAYLRAVSQTTHLRFRGRGEFTQGTLYYGKHSRRWAIKLYSKGEELLSRKKDHRLPTTFAPDAFDALHEFALPAVRVEVVLRSMEIKSIGLDNGKLWNEEISKGLAQQYMENLQMSDNIKLPDDVVLSLPKSLGRTYMLWLHGHDLRTCMGRTQYYQHRRDLKEHGIDIGVPCDNPERTNVVPMVQYLVGKEMGVPEWAKGTGACPDFCVNGGWVNGQASGLQTGW